MINLTIGTSAADQAMMTMRQSIKEFASKQMGAELVEREIADLNRSSPETARAATNRVETTLREEPRGADGWRWWEEQEREPSGISEDGEFISFPPGHWRLRRRRRRRRYAGRRRRRSAVQAVFMRGIRRRIRRAVMPRQLRRLKTNNRAAARSGRAPRPTRCWNSDSQSSEEATWHLLDAQPCRHGAQGEVR